MAGRLIRIGTRASQLARWQADHVQSLLAAAYPEAGLEQVLISTIGDRETRVPLASFGGVGVFTKEIEAALLDGRIDVAVHSLKDLPTVQPDGLSLGAILEREDPRDAFVARGVKRLDDLPTGARVATSSVRRRAQLLHRRPDLEIVSIRGNVPTRLRKLEEEELDAVILATAGLKRLGLDGAITEKLSPETMLPAPGQGAVAVELRADGDDELALVVADALHHAPTAAQVIAERAVMHEFGGGCHTPIGAFAEVNGGDLRLEAVVASPDGRRLERRAGSGIVDSAEDLGVTVARALIDAGGREFVEEPGGDS